MTNAWRLCLVSRTQGTLLLCLPPSSSRGFWYTLKPDTYELLAARRAFTMSSSAPAPKKRKVSENRAAASAAPTPKKTANSLKPIIDQATLPRSASEEDVSFDAQDPTKFLHAKTPFKCKLTTRLGAEDPYNNLRDNETGYYIEMNAPLHLCSVKFKLNVDIAANEARHFSVLATTDHGELTEALNAFSGVQTDGELPVIDMNKLVDVINAYWSESMRRAMFFVDCERRFWRLLGRFKAPTLPVPPTLWKDNKKRKRNAIPLFEKVLEGIDEDEAGTRALYGRPELLHKVGGARIRIMTLKHDKTSFTLSWHFTIDSEAKAASEIQAIAVEDSDDNELPPMPELPEEPSELVQAGQEEQDAQDGRDPPPVNGDDLQAAALAAGNAQIDPPTGKKDEKLTRPKPGFSPGKRSAQKITFDRIGKLIPTDFEDVLLHKGLRYATLHVAQTLFPPDCIQDLTQLEISEPLHFDLAPKLEQGQPAQHRPDSMQQAFDDQDAQQVYERPGSGDGGVYLAQQRQPQQHFYDQSAFDPQLQVQDQNYGEPSGQASSENQSQSNAFQYEQQLSSQLQSQMPMQYPPMANMHQQHVPPQYQPAVPSRYDYQNHGPYQR